MSSKLTNAYEDVHDTDTRFSGRRRFCTVTVDADPGRDLGLLGQPGHRFFFELDELEPAP